MDPLYPTQGHRYLAALRGPAKAGPAAPTSHLGAFTIPGYAGRPQPNPNRPGKPVKPAGGPRRIPIDRVMGGAVRQARPPHGQALVIPPHHGNPAANPATTPGPHHPGSAGHPAFTSHSIDAISTRPRSHLEAIHSVAMPHLVAASEGAVAGPMATEARRLAGEPPSHPGAGMPPHRTPAGHPTPRPRIGPGEHLLHHPASRPSAPRPRIGPGEHLLRRKKA